MESRATLIDFAGPGKNIFQVTVNYTHELRFSGLAELFLASGHITQDGPDNYQIVESQIDKINLYWVIPYGVETKWKGRVECFKKNTKDSTPTDLFLKRCLEAFVIQHILVMDENPVKRVKFVPQRQIKQSILTNK
jgi:hypothetical protein